MNIVKTQHRLFKKYKTYDSRILLFIALNETDRKCTCIIYKMENEKLKVYWSDVMSMLNGNMNNEKELAHDLVKNLFGIELEKVNETCYNAKIRTLDNFAFSINIDKHNNDNNNITLRENKVFCIQMNGLDIGNAHIDDIFINCITSLNKFEVIRVDITPSILDILKTANETMPYIKWIQYLTC